MLDYLTLLLSPSSIICVVIAILGWYLYKSTLLPRGFPPGPPRLPLIGNLALIKKDYARRHVLLTELSRKYGPVMGLKFGSLPVVVLGSAEVVKEAFVDNEDCYGRPEMMPAINKLFIKDGRKRGIIQNGDQWWINRTITAKAVTSGGFGGQNEDRILTEIENLCDEIKKTVNKPVCLFELTENSCHSILCSILMGSRFKYSKKTFMDFIKSSFFYVNPASVSSIVNFFPKLKVFMGKNWLSGVLNEVNKAEGFIENRIKEHEEEFNSKKIDDFIDYVLYYNQQKREEDKMSIPDVDRCILDCLGGATSVFAGLDWLLLYMATYPEIQDNCFNEISRVILNHRAPKLTDKQQLSYVCATINESLRLSPPAAFGVPYATLKDTKLGNYTLPKDTLIITNIYGIHTDEKRWPNASEFYPDRWLDKDRKLTDSENFLPFGVGQRRCVGAELAMSELFLIFTSLIQRFHFQLPDPSNPPSLQGKFALTNRPEDYKLVIKYRSIKFIYTGQKSSLM